MPMVQYCPKLRDVIYGRAQVKAEKQSEASVTIPTNFHSLNDVAVKNESDLEMSLDVAASSLVDAVLARVLSDPKLTA